jgi:mono/diheme cytochrome c family protein
MRLKKSQKFMMALTAGALLVGCGGGGDGGAAGDAASQAAEAEMPAASEPGPLDPELAAQGAELMKAKGGSACHSVGGGRLVGPDLAGVTERRAREFVLAMITNPDSMLANDADARQMLAEYYTPMANQNVTRADALALYEYFRSVDVE